MKKNLYFFLLFASFHAAAQAQITCVLQGELVDRPYSKALLLSRYGETEGVEIPLREGRFEYTLDAPRQEAWQLVVVDSTIVWSWHPVVVFAENDTIRLRLYPNDRRDENQVEGGVLNAEYQACRQAFAAEFAAETRALAAEREAVPMRDVLTPRAWRLLDAAENAVDERESGKLYDSYFALAAAGEHWSERGLALHEKERRLLQRQNDWEYARLSRAATIPALFRLRELMADKRRQDPRWRELYEREYRRK